MCNKKTVFWKLQADLSVWNLVMPLRTDNNYTDIASRKSCKVYCNFLCFNVVLETMRSCTQVDDDRLQVA